MSPTSNPKPLATIAIQGGTLVAAVIAAIAGLASYSRVVAQTEFNKDAIIIVNTRVEKLADSTASLALSLAEFAATLSANQINAKEDLEELKSRVRALETIRSQP